MQTAKGTGIPQNTISWIELDKGIPNIQQCVLLANYFEMSLDELIGREQHYNENNNITQNNIFGNNIYNKGK